MKCTLETLPFTGPWLLAPMEGVTDPSFRDLVLARHRPEDLGGAFTEFVRVVDRPLPRRVLERHLGERRFRIPVGLQLMGRDLAALAGTLDAALELGVPVVDLNFGCPAKGALKGCAGSAVLRDPSMLEMIVRACVDAARGRAPVTAKIRAGYDDDTLLEDLASAAESGGAALLTVHCRTRKEGYQDQVDWTRLARAVQAVDIPVCGNGGVNGHADLQRMRRETGCAFVMIGRGALSDPWIFSGQNVTREEAARFLLEYAEGMLERGGAPLRGAAARVKGLLRWWKAGGLIQDETQRTRWLREHDPEALFEWLRTSR